MAPQNHDLASTNCTEVNEQELARLTVVDHLLTTQMGGVLPEQSDPARFRYVLDVGCGTGDWLLEGARKYPGRAVNTGIDISHRAIQQACARATEEGLAQQVDFRVMDALRRLDFPDASFDVTNLRFGMSFARTWEWLELLAEMQRVTCPGGVIRLTEAEVLHMHSGPALTRLDQLFLRAYSRAWRLFEPNTTGLTAHLAPLLQRIGCQQVQQATFPLTFRAGSEEGQCYAKHIEALLKTARPFLLRWGGEPCESYETLSKLVHQEMQQSDFVVTWTLHTI